MVDETLNMIRRDIHQSGIVTNLRDDGMMDDHAVKPTDLVLQPLICSRGC